MHAIAALSPQSSQNHDFFPRDLLRVTAFSRAHIWGRPGFVKYTPTREHPHPRQDEGFLKSHASRKSRRFPSHITNEADRSGWILDVLLRKSQSDKSSIGNGVGKKEFYPSMRLFPISGTYYFCYTTWISLKIQAKEHKLTKLAEIDFAFPLTSWFR